MLRAALRFFLPFVALLFFTAANAQNPILPPQVEIQSLDAAQRYLQRSAEIFEFKRAAQSGVERGREIFYYKCWMCHNDFANQAPKLAGVFKREMLVTGKPVSDANIREQILNGSANMAAYRYTLAAADLDDLVSFLKEDCCWKDAEPPLNPRYIAGAASVSAGPTIPGVRESVSLGGAKGLVRTNKNEPLEGMMVQLISKKTHIRTTVFTNSEGHYEFPKLEAGDYTLRIAQPREFFPFTDDNVKLEGSPQLADIVLTRFTTTELLPNTPYTAPQMTGAEWLMSLSGSGEEKKILTNYCNWCHSYQQIFRNKYDEAGWSKIIYRMTRGAGSPLINVREPGRMTKDEEAMIVKWLASVRGPNSKDPSFVTLPRAQGKATRVVITEYELPRNETATHDVSGDSQGRVWYSTHRSSFVGRLDPLTGKVEEFKVPPPPANMLPGTHWIHVDANDKVWGSENWAHAIWSLDTKTMDFKRVFWKVREPANSPMGGNYSLDPEGTIWRSREKSVNAVSPVTGEVVRSISTKKFAGTYGSATSKDGQFFGGGAWPKDGVVVANLKTGEVWEPDATPNTGPARGEFGPDDSYWSGGRGGALVQYETARKRLREYRIPTPYASMYSANVDRNGEVWAGEMHTGRYLRFDPKEVRFTEYVLPEPYGIDRETWIDNSTTPVTVWYVDQEGYIARIQPLE